jgi:pentapeptide repeat protein
LLFAAQLQGASLGSAKLDSASLFGAKLQGADFRGASLICVNMEFTYIWRAVFEEARLEKDRVLVSDIPLSKKDFAALKDEITKIMPEKISSETSGTQKAERIEIVDPDIFGPEASARTTLEHARVDRSAYEKALADQLKDLACSGVQEAPYIVRGLMEPGRFLELALGVHSRISEAGAQAPSLVEAILGRDCPVSATLTEDDKTDLRDIAQEAAAKAPEP